MQMILVPFDGSKHAQKALHIAGDLAEKYKCSICILTIMTPLEENVATVRTKAQEMLEKARAKLSTRSISNIITQIDSGDPVECILIAIKKHKASTIVMGCRGEKSSNMSQFGSVSQKVFSNADCTCICVK